LVLLVPCVGLSRERNAFKDMLRTFASVSAFQTTGMMLKPEDVDRVKSVQVEANTRMWNQMETDLVCFRKKSRWCWWRGWGGWLLEGMAKI
jgi:hypothetical protein